MWSVGIPHKPQDILPLAARRGETALLFKVSKEKQEDPPRAMGNGPCAKSMVCPNPPSHHQHTNENPRDSTLLELLLLELPWNPNFKRSSSARSAPANETHHLYPAFPTGQADLGLLLIEPIKPPGWPIGLRRIVDSENMVAGRAFSEPGGRIDENVSSRARRTREIS